MIPNSALFSCFLSTKAVFIMANQRKIGGAQKRRRMVFGTRKRGKRRTQVHEKSGRHMKKMKIDLPDEEDKP